MSDAWEAGVPNPLQAISKANGGTSLCWLPSAQAYRAFAELGWGPPLLRGLLWGAFPPPANIPVKLISCSAWGLHPAPREFPKTCWFWGDRLGLANRAVPTLWS